MVDEDYVAVSAEKNSLRARRLACPTACGVKTASMSKGATGRAEMVNKDCEAVGAEKRIFCGLSNGGMQ